MAACTVTLGVGFYIALRHDINFKRKDFKDLVYTESKLIGEYSVDAIRDNNKSSTREILKKANSIQEFKSIEIYDRNGDLFTLYGTTVEKTPYHIRFTKDTAMFLPNLEELKVTHIIVSEGKHYGYIIVHTSTKDLDLQIKEDIKSLLFTAVLIIFIGGLITFFAQTAVSNPIFKLTKYLKIVAQTSNIGRTIKVKRQDEIGQIYEATNYLIKQIKNHADEKEAFFEEIKKNNEKLGNTLEAFSDGFWEYDVIENEWYFSDLWLSTFGYKRNHLKKENHFFENMIHPDDLDHYKMELNNHLKGYSVFFDCQFRLLGKKGGYVWVNFRGRWVEEKGGKITSLLGITNNIQEEKDKEQKDKEANELKIHDSKLLALNKTIAGVSHSLKNILNPIFGYADFGSQVTNDNLLRNELILIRNSANKANGIIDDLLLFSGQYPENKTPVDVIEIIKSIDRNSDDLEFEFASTLSKAVVLGDSKMLKKAIKNLLINAKQSSENSGAIRVSIDYYVKNYDSNNQMEDLFEISNKEYVQIVIEDEGIGIDEQRLSMIYEPFYTTKTVGEGIGLGLSVTKGIITTHNGFIYISSEPFEGTKCTILIPILT